MQERVPQEPAPATAPMRPAPDQASSSTLLRLQASAGNAAVAGLLAQRRSETVIARTFVPRDDDPTVHQWRAADDAAPTGRYRLVFKMERTRCFLDLDAYDALPADVLAAVGSFAEITSAGVQTLATRGLLWTGTRALNRVPAPLAANVADAIAMVLNSDLHIGAARGGEMGRMDFRFPPGDGTLYFDEDSPSAAELTAEFRRQHPGVEFVPVRREQLEERRAQVEADRPPHYRERTAHRDWVYDRTRSDPTPRKASSTFAVPGRSVKDPAAATPADLAAALAIDDRLAPVARVQSARATAELRARDRGNGQSAAMGNVNAAAYALAAGVDNAARTDWQWLHVRGARLGGVTGPTNLVAGTDAANSAMIAIEKDVLGLSAMAAPGQALSIDWHADVDPRHPHLGVQIAIVIRAPAGLVAADGSTLLERGQGASWTFDPRSAAVFDRLDRDLQWGAAVGVRQAQQRHDPHDDVPRGLDMGAAPMEDDGGAMVRHGAAAAAVVRYDDVFRARAPASAVQAVAEPFGGIDGFLTHLGDQLRGSGAVLDVAFRGAAFRMEFGPIVRILGDPRLVYDAAAAATELDEVMVRLRVQRRAERAARADGGYELDQATGKRRRSAAGAGAMVPAAGPGAALGPAQLQRLLARLMRPILVPRRQLPPPPDPDAAM